MNSTIYTNTHCGNRKENEDILYSKKIDDDCSFHILADGMGGYSQGRYAATLIVEEISNYIDKNYQCEDIEKLLTNAIEEANRCIGEQSEKQHCKMGATVSVLFCKENSAWVAWLGNVRVYRINNKKLEQLTEDHTLSKQSHIVTRCIKGKTFEMSVPCVQTPILPKDRFILCSDGFYKSINEEDFLNCDAKGLISSIEEADDNYSVIEIIFKN